MRSSAFMVPRKLVYYAVDSVTMRAARPTQENRWREAGSIRAEWGAWSAVAEEEP